MMAKRTRGSAIGAIVSRAARVIGPHRPDFKPSKALLLIQLAHERTPLRLTAMAKGPEFDLIHDVIGIYDNFDPTTGGYRNYWTPRYTKVAK